MDRKVTISDPALDQIIDAVVGLASHVQNLYDMAYRHRHFEPDGDLPEGGKWTTHNDALREADLADARDALRDIRVELEGLRQS